MSIKALQEFTRISKYALYNPELKRRETWQEQVDRVFNMHRKFHEKHLEELEDDIDFAYKMMLKKRILGSQRALQFGGDPILKKMERLYNCAAHYIDRPRAFQETMFLLLCGCGVGFSVQKHHIQKLPQISPRSKEVKEYIIPDSIEGWADSAGVLMSSYFDSNNTPFPEYRGKKVVFNFSLIRPKGAPLSSGSKAPGPDGLRDALNNVELMMEEIVKEHKKLRPIHAYDILMHLSNAVLSGGVRRSATICLFSPSDDEMATAKVGDWFSKNPQRGRSNNSALLIRSETKKEEFESLMKNVKEFGEPGFVWADDKEALFNPCCLSPFTEIKTDSGDVTIREIAKNPTKYRVLTYNEQTKVNEYKQVLSGKLMRRYAPVYHLQIRNIQTGLLKSLFATKDHRIYSSRGICRIDELTLNDKIIQLDDIDVKTCRMSEIIKLEFHQLIDVYDIEVSDNHNFFANGILVHNCEIGLYGYDDQGNSGISFCNLAEINMKKCPTEADFYDSCKAAAILGTLQAAYTKFPYLGEVTENIVKREALLGVSMTGMMDSPEISFDPKIQRQGARIVKAVNEKIARIIGINPAARLCCVKPSGTSSCILGTSSGIHPHHSTRYIRRVQCNKLESPAIHFAKINPRAVEQSIWKETDMIISFVCEIPPGMKHRNNLDAIEMLKNVKTTQMNWVRTGTVEERCVKPWLLHNVSNTITVRDHEWDTVTNFIWNNRKYFSGISLLPWSGDKDYPQAPFTSVPLPNELLKEYGTASFFASGLIVNAIQLFKDLWKACDFLLDVQSTDEETIDKKTFKIRSQKFADRYLGGDVKRLTYLLKDVHNIKLFDDLSREYKDVDWSEMKEDSDEVDFGTISACSGGVCELGSLGETIKEKTTEK